MKLSLPDEVLEVLGREPEREVLEGVLLLLVGEGRMDLERAGAILGLEGREAAARWYAGRTLPPSELETKRIVEEIVHLEDLTQEDLDRSDRFLDMPPARKGSGFSDVSINHDKYLAEDD
ncbi:MAG: hypothetical protein ACRDSJ_14625 [Rubrobacteraceae bacterium]